MKVSLEAGELLCGNLSSRLVFIGERWKCAECIEDFRSTAGVQRASRALFRA